MISPTESQQQLYPTKPRVKQKSSHLLEHYNPKSPLHPKNFHSNYCSPSEHSTRSSSIANSECESFSSDYNISDRDVDFSLNRQAVTPVEKNYDLSSNSANPISYSEANPSYNHTISLPSSLSPPALAKSNQSFGFSNETKSESLYTGISDFWSSGNQIEDWEPVASAENFIPAPKNAAEVFQYSNSFSSEQVEHLKYDSVPNCFSAATRSSTANDESSIPTPSYNCLNSLPSDLTPTHSAIPSQNSCANDLYVFDPFIGLTPSNFYSDSNLCNISTDMAVSYDNYVSISGTLSNYQNLNQDQLKFPNSTGYWFCDTGIPKPKAKSKCFELKKQSKLASKPASDTVSNEFFDELIEMGRKDLEKQSKLKVKETCDVYTTDYFDELIELGANALNVSTEKQNSIAVDHVVPNITSMSLADESDVFAIINKQDVKNCDKSSSLNIFQQISNLLVAQTCDADGLGGLHHSRDKLSEISTQVELLSVQNQMRLLCQSHPNCDSKDCDHQVMEYSDKFQHAPSLKNLQNSSEQSEVYGRSSTNYSSLSEIDDKALSVNHLHPMLDVNLKRTKSNITMSKKSIEKIANKDFFKIPSRSIDSGLGSLSEENLACSMSDIPSSAKSGLIPYENNLENGIYNSSKGNFTQLQQFSFDLSEL